MTQEERCSWQGRDLSQAQGGWYDGGGWAEARQVEARAWGKELKLAPKTSGTHWRPIVTNVLGIAWDSFREEVTTLGGTQSDRVTLG